jgi:hypothetical protein
VFFEQGIDIGMARGIEGPKGVYAVEPQAGRGFYGAPETFIVDANGVIRFKHIGVINYRIWEDEIMPAIIAVRSGDNS